MKEEYELKKAQVELTKITEIATQSVADQAPILGDDLQVHEAGVSVVAPATTGEYKADIRKQIQILREVHESLIPHFETMRSVMDKLSQILHGSQNVDAKEACALLRAVTEQSDDLLRSVVAAADSADAYIAVV